MSKPDETDWSLWEQKYGRPLTEVEKLEIKTNLVGFFKILIEEDQRMKAAEKKVDAGTTPATPV